MEPTPEPNNHPLRRDLLLEKLHKTAGKANKVWRFGRKQMSALQPGTIYIMGVKVVAVDTEDHLELYVKK
jgi:hypothetical protein